MDTVNNTLNNLNVQLLQFFNNQYVAAILLIVFIFYGGAVAPALPGFIAKLFDFTVFKIFILALILFTNNYNPQIAIVVAIGFFLSLQTLARYKLFEMAGEYLEEGKEMVSKATGYGDEESSNSEEGDEAKNVVEQNYGLNTESQVSGMSARTPFYQGPQGMKHPVGFSGVEQGDLF